MIFSLRPYAFKSRSDQRHSRPRTRAEQVNLHQAAADVPPIKEQRRTDNQSVYNMLSPAIKGDGSGVNVDVEHTIIQEFRSYNMLFMLLFIVLLSLVKCCVCICPNFPKQGNSVIRIEDPFQSRTEKRGR